MPLTLDPEFQKTLEPMLPVLSSIPGLPVGDVEDRRARLKALFAGLPPKPPVDGVSIEKHTSASYDAALINIHRFFPTKLASESGPAIVHFHGGGRIAGDVAMVSHNLARQVSSTGVQVFSVEYRLAPEYPHPVAAEDGYAAVLWLQQRSDEFRVDPARIAVQGESAGGGLAAGVALLARDRKLSPPLKKQILIYPMLDDRNQKSMPEELGVYVRWKAEDNETGWRALLGEAYQSEGVSPYAAPARAESLEGLPSTYIDVGSLDLFVDECAEYVARLVAGDVDVEFHLYPGLPHLFELLAPGIRATKKAEENRFDAIRRL